MSMDDQIEVPKGTILFRQGDSSDTMFVVDKGRVRLTLGAGAEGQRARERRRRQIGGRHVEDRRSYTGRSTDRAAQYARRRRRRYSWVPSRSIRRVKLTKMSSSVG